MQQLTRLCAVLLLAFTLAVPAFGQCRSLHAKGGELWSTDANGESHRVLVDEKGIARARFSPAGDRIAYVQDFDLHGEVVSHIIVVDGDGQRLADLPIRADLGINDVLNFGWLDEKHVWTEGHVTPSSGMYHEWNLATGRAENERLGAWFAPSPDGQSLAYREHVPHGAPASIGDRVLVNDRVVYPAEGDTRSHRVRDLVWKDNGQLSLVDEVAGVRETVVIDTNRGGMRRMRSNAAGDDTPKNDNALDTICH